MIGGIQFNIMLTVALAVLLGTFGARLFKRLKIPQVVAYIVIGVVLGSSGLKLIDARTADGLTPFSLLALGIIGFMIGSELKLTMFRKHGRSALAILLAEGLGAFVVVTLLIGLVTGNWPLALVLGAISSATAPAATVDVLWEYRSAGVLTSMVLAIVALDDGLALLLFGFAAAVARTLLDRSPFSALTVLRPLVEIIGAVALGGLVAVAFRWLARHIRERELVLALALGTIMLLVGASEALHVDMILAAMTFGAVYANLAGRDSDEVVGIVRHFAPPLFVLFFVLVGARLSIGAMTPVMWLAAAVYVLGRSGGKFAGVWLGARLTLAPAVVRRFLGFCLFSQAGVAIGLAVLSASVFAGHPEMSAAIVGIVTATTLIVQLIGPPSVRYAIIRAGEAGRNVSPEDLLASFRVGDVMKTDQPSFRLDAPLETVFATVAHSDAVYFPVVDDDVRPLGVVTLEGLKATLSLPDVGPFLVAGDLMEPVQHTIGAGASLKEAQQLMHDRGRDYLVVVDQSGRLAGFLIERRIRQVLQVEIAKRRQTDAAVVAAAGE
ncbi:MAG: cation:proton antiporter [bacterium]